MHRPVDFVKEHLTDKFRQQSIRPVDSALAAGYIAHHDIAQMAELVDALVSGTSAARRGGSSPLLGTIFYGTRC
jgi:hypothetical protein